MEITKNTDQVGALAQSMLAGFEVHYQDLGLPKSIGDVTQAGAKDLSRREMLYRASISDFTQTIQPALAETEAKAEAALKGAVKILRLKLGERWTPGWTEPGFVNNSTKIPTDALSRQRLLLKLEAYFKKHPELDNEKLSATSAVFKDRAKALETALQKASQHEVAHGKFAVDRTRAAARLRSRLRNMITELEHVLNASDSRWEAFGLPTPAAERASKPALVRKAASKAETRVIRKLEAGMSKAEDAKARAEKARVRADKAEVLAARLRDDANKAAAAAERLFNAVKELASASGKAMPQVPSGRNGQALQGIDATAVELVG